MKLTNRELEIVAVPICIAANCIPCTRYHVREAASLGATQLDIVSAMGAALSATALAAVGEIAIQALAREFAGSADSPDPKLALLADVGIAACTAHTSQLLSAINKARAGGCHDVQCMQVVGLARSIRQKAESYLDLSVNSLDASPCLAAETAGLCR